MFVMNNVATNGVAMDGVAVNNDSTLTTKCGRPVLSDTYRNHKITASVEAGIYVGKVFSKGAQLAYCEAPERAQAEQHLRLIVDRDIEKRCQRRGQTPVLSDELNAALVEVKAYLEPDHISMLRGHYQTERGVISLEKLAALGHCASTTEVYCVYANIARCLCDELAYNPPIQHNGRDPMLAMLLQAPDYDSSPRSSLYVALESTIRDALIAVQW